MPAWQFFSLIPWYTDNAPSSDAQVATHFSTKRPVLGICLKRYSVDSKGRATRLGTKVDIPIEIGLPHFIQDDSRFEDAPTFGNFKLSLQSVVCHRGNSVNAGHYIAFARSTSSDRSGTVPGEDSSYWLRFDDLATQARITLADIQKSLDSETPYLLFYQILPVDGDPGGIMDKPPVYLPSGAHDSGISGVSSTSPQLQPIGEIQPISGRPSLEVDHDGMMAPPDPGRQPSIAFAETTSGSRQPSPTGRKNESLSRTTSSTNDGIRRTLSKLAGNRSKEALPATSVNEVQPQVDVHEVSEPTTPYHQPRRNSSSHVQKPGPTQKSHRRDRSKNRLSKEDRKPDRECLVM